MVELNTTSALANYATELVGGCEGREREDARRLAASRGGAPQTTRRLMRRWEHDTAGLQDTREAKEGKEDTACL
uniref:Uncharacterized protein n=1 Tax=Timema genevievae TaxID=629358 RepID=A0A7R9JR62_TIMGE|nr:unnamed protein product [Timema genevievae]